MAAPLRSVLSRHVPEVALGALVVLIVGMMIVPLPTWLLDVLIATNLSLALLLLLTSLFVREALRFGAFPTILLVTTLFRLALNVSSTRLVLLQADAGEVIESFGEFVVQGNYVVGAVVFLILTIIQLVVIARGSERVAEVGARFTLDAMPGKQLAIDADARAGLLDAEGAAARRRALERESQFYGAMDGAMKFVKGDAIAAIIITLINITGGLAVGVLMHDMDAGQALRLYGLLTIGDGLVSQIPALLISTAAGLVVTRVASEDEAGTLGGDIGAQIFGDWRALGVAAGFAALLAVVPGLPFVPFAFLAALLGGTGWILYRRRPTPRLAFRDVGAPPSGPLELRVGRGLAARVASDPTFSDRLGTAGAALYDALGVRLPPVAPEPRGGDPDAYEIRLGAVAVDRGRCPDGRAFVTGDDLGGIDPSVELDGDGGWITAARLGAARAAGLDPRDAARVLVDRVLAAVRARPAALLGLQETQRELDRLGREAPALVRAVVPDRLGLARLATLLRGLVDEGVSVRSLREVLEAASVDPLPDTDGALVETIRVRLARPITHAFVDDDGVLRAHAVDPMIEDALRDGDRADGPPALEPELARDVVDAVRRAAGDRTRTVLLTQPDVRRPLRLLLAAELPDVTILSYRELDPAVRIERLGTVAP